MLIRLSAIALSALLLVACSKNMSINVAPPECTVDEKSDCSTIRQEPNAMTDEPFFQKDRK
ncbi:MAG: hypothetical protein FJX23_06305 [Alphaproteobacteria bacterium]|nr:hypothetical protein [Alphaproteobacteria bacterium]